MDQPMKASSIMASDQAKENGDQMYNKNNVMNMKGSIKTTRKMVLASINGLMDHNTKAFLKMISNKEKAQ